MKLGRYLLRSMTVILIFWALGRVACELIPGELMAPTFYPASGFAVAILYLWGLRFVPAVLIGKLLAVTSFTTALLPAAGVVVAGVFQIVLAVVLLRRFGHFSHPAKFVSQTRGLILFLTLAAGIAPLAGAMLAYPPLVLVIGPSADFGYVTWNWWQTHALGIIAIAPAMFYWSDGYRVHLTIKRALGLAVYLLLAGLATWIAFTQMPLTILLFPVLGGAALFLGQAAVTLAIPLIVTLASDLSLHGVGLFAAVPPGGEIFHLQLFNLVTSMATLILAAAVAEQKEVEAIRARESARQVSARRLRVSAEASRVLSLSLEYDSILKSITRLLTEMDVADFSIITVWPNRGQTFFAASHQDQTKEVILQRMCEERTKDDEIWLALSNGRSIQISDPEVLLADLFRNSPETLAMANRLKVGSILFSPIMIRGELMGVFTLGQVKARVHEFLFDESEVRFIESLASRCAYAIDNARLYQEAQAALRDRQEFFSLAAHELKTPITSIRAFAQLLNRQFEASSRQVDPKRLSRGLQVIDQQADRLARLVSQLLDIARIESGQLKVERKEDVCLATLAKRVVERFRESSNFHAFTLNAPSRLTGYLDPVRIEHMFTHLLDHAVRYSPDGGEIQMTLAQDGDRLVFSVRDWGIGISSKSEKRDGIFDRFLGAPLQGHVSGLGLGLFVSRQIIEMHGGRIQIESPNDGGTRVVVEIPNTLKSAPLTMADHGTGLAGDEFRGEIS